MSAPKFLVLGLGALAPPIAEQVAAHGLRLSESDAAKFQRAREAITFLHLHGFLDDEDDEEEEGVGRLRQRLTEAVAEAAVSIEETVA